MSNQTHLDETKPKVADSKSARQEPKTPVTRERTPQTQSDSRINGSNGSSLLFQKRAFAAKSRINSNLSSVQTQDLNVFSKNLDQSD